MEEQITIKTDTAGMALAESAKKGMELYTNRIDELSKQDKMLDALYTLNVEHSNEIELLKLKQLIALDALLAICISDIHLISNELYLSKVGLQKVFYIKHANLVIYETIQNFNSKKDLVQSMVLKETNSIIDYHSETIKLLNSFVKKYKVKSSVRNIRNKLGGHIDKDFSLWYKTALSLDGEHTGNMIIAFLEVTTRLQKTSSNLITSYLEMLIRLAEESKNRILAKLVEAENYIKKQNEKQPDNLKIDIDLNNIRDLL